MASINSPTYTPPSIVGQKFKRRDKEVYITVVEADEEKTHTCLIEFNDGKTMKLSISTLKDAKLWLPYDGDVPKPDAPEPETYVPGTDTEESGVLVKRMPEEQRAKIVRPKSKLKKTTKIAKVPKDAGPSVEEVLSRLTDVVACYNCTCVAAKAVKFLFNIRYEDKPIMEVYAGRESLKVFVRPSVAQLFPDVSFVKRNGTAFKFAVSFGRWENFNNIIPFIVPSIEHRSQVTRRSKTIKNKEENENGTI